MLMASCETTRALASTLNIMTDRLAVLCTSPINDHRTLGSDFTKIWPLSSIKVRKLKTVLDAIVNTKEKPTACSWANTIKVATETLLRSPMLDPDTEFLQDTFGHIIIMTNNANGLSAGMLSHEKLRFHIICPASVPLSDFETMDCNGWKLRSICGDEPQAVDPRKDVNPTTLLNRLRRLIAYARSGKDTGKLTYLSLDIKAGPNCSIQDVMGESEYLTLHPGELRTVLVRLKIRPSKVGENLLTCSTPLPDLFSESGDTLKSIEEFLRLIPRPRTILTARLMYKHSLLPTDTTCSITGECKVENQLSSPRSTAFPQRLLVEESAGLQSMVHERLAYYIATHGSPRHALGAFSTEFGEEGWRSFCPDYSHLILKELKYQARILERLEIDASPKKPILPLTMDMASSPESDRGHFVNQDLRDIENHRPESCVIDNPDKEGSSSYNSQGPLVVNKKQPARRTQQKGEKATEARAGKNDQGKKSRGLNLFAQGRAMSLNHEEQRSNDKRRFVGLRHQSSGSQQTLTHKSSMGTLAVRRIFSAGESMGKGLGAA